ncbi:MAG: folate-binding protein YgfZ [Caulobacteraceae bacterium]|nr:folate-binding protein YgfZ [Caulobacteraceae bacterium]
MAEPLRIARLDSRALISIRGPDWIPFLQGLLTQSVEDLKPGDLRFAALLTPQGRLLFDLFLIGGDEGCLIDCERARRALLIQRLTFYRLRAKVEIAADERPIYAAWGQRPDAEAWAPDPRLAGLGWRTCAAVAAPGASEADYQAHRLALGVPGPADWGSEAVYPLEADFDLLNGVDFRKGCFVGQETTSRMKRRGALRSRMLPIDFEGPPPAPGTEVLTGAGLRAGECLSGAGGRSMALLRLDRIEGQALSVDGRPCRAVRPPWMEGE